MQRGAVTADKANIIRGKKGLREHYGSDFEIQMEWTIDQKDRSYQTDSRKHRKPEQTYYH